MAERRKLIFKTSFAFAPHKWRPWSGLRGSLGLALPVLLAGWSGHLAWGILGANGALNVALPGMGSVAARRLQVMLSVSVGTALLAFVGILVGQSTLATALCTALAATLLTLYGNGGVVNTSVSIASINTMIVLAGLQLSPALAWVGGLVVLGGGLLQTLLLAVVWPISPLRRERESVAQVYASLGRLLTSSLRSDWSTSELLSPLPEAQTLQEAWAVLGEAYSLNWQPEHASMRHALRIAEGLRAAMIGYLQADRQWHNQPNPSEQNTQAEQLTQALIQALREVERHVRQGHPALEASTEQQLRHLHEQQQGELQTWFGLMVQLLGDLNTEPVRPLDPDIPPTTSVWEALKKWPRLTWNAGTRYALKYGAVLGLCTLLVRLLNVPHGYWLVLTAGVVLRQEYVVTLTRGIGRLGGTLAGVLVAAALSGWLHPNQTQLALLSLLGAFLTFSLFPTGYAAFSTAITVYVVFAISASGLAEGVIVTQRLALTVLGGLIALLSYLIYPNWKGGSSRLALQKAAQAQREYLDMVALLHRHLSASTLELASQARAQARKLRLQAEDSVQASLLEPSRRQDAQALSPAQAKHLLDRLNANAALSLSLHVRAGQTQQEAQKGQYPDTAAELSLARAANAQLLKEIDTP